SGALDNTAAFFGKGGTGAINLAPAAPDPRRSDIPPAPGWTFPRPQAAPASVKVCASGTQSTARASLPRERARVMTRRLQYNLAGTAPRSWWRSSPSSSDYKKSGTRFFRGAEHLTSALATGKNSLES